LRNMTVFRDLKAGADCADKQETVNSFLLWLPWVLLAAALAAGAWLRHRNAVTLAELRRDSEQLAVTQTTLRRISQAFESTSDAIGIGDMEGNSLYHNRAHVALFGYTTDELNAVPENGVLFADKTVAQEIHRSIREGRSWHGETDIMTKAGRRVPAFVRADLIRDEAGWPVGIYGVFADLTEEYRRRAEAASRMISATCSPRWGATSCSPSARTVSPSGWRSDSTRWRKSSPGPAT
jgi:PAS domain S-box-containing protein